MFLGASLYVAFFFLIRTLFKKKTLFSKKIFAASIKKMAAIMLIIFAGFMMMYFVYEFLIFILQYAAIPAFIQDNIITHDTFVRYARYTGTTAIYAIIFSVFISSCFAWVGVIDEGENSVSHAIFKLGKNFYRLALIIISIYVITVGTAYLLRIIPWEINIPQKVINAFMILFAFVTYLKAYKFIYKQKK
jgi:hypothetical protein